MREQRAKLSLHNDVAQAIDYMLKRWAVFACFLDDGHICMSNNSAERALRGIALGRRNYLFAGSDNGGERAASIYTMVASAKLNGINPEIYLKDTLTRIAEEHPINRVDALVPWRIASTTTPQPP